MKTKRFASITQPGLYFWAEPIGMKTKGYHVISQAKGFPATEAYDDWFANIKDAEQIAQKLSKNENI